MLHVFQNRICSSFCYTSHIVASTQLSTVSDCTPIQRCTACVPLHCKIAVFCDLSISKRRRTFPKKLGLNSDTWYLWSAYIPVRRLRIGAERGRRGRPPRTKYRIGAALCRPNRSHFQFSFPCHSGESQSMQASLDFCFRRNDSGRRTRVARKSGLPLDAGSSPA